MTSHTIKISMCLVITSVCICKGSDWYCQEEGRSLCKARNEEDKINQRQKFFTADYSFIAWRTPIISWPRGPNVVEWAKRIKPKTLLQ